MRCNVLQYVVLQCVTVCYSALQRVCAVKPSPDYPIRAFLQQSVAACCSVLQRVAACCSVLQRVAACCSLFQRVAVCYSVLQCVAVHCSALQCLQFGWCGWCGSALQCVAVCVVCCSALQDVAVCSGLWCWEESKIGNSSVFFSIDLFCRV